MQEDNRTTKLQAALEVLSIIAPIVCLADCIVIPILFMILPLIGVHQIFHGVGDQLVLLIVLSICAPTITIGFLKHRRKSVMILMMIGFALMFCANFAGQIIDESLHLALSLLGSALLIRANIINRRLQKASSCCNHHH
ncbi:MAG: MerC domain-containing protein [Candidatus Obscuribacterales bacterium]|nr:MerC domain-containing protein [Candidatus Obscuribacterales bacterium]